MAITKVTTDMKTPPTSAEVTAHVTAFDDNELKNDIALLGFKIAAGDSAVKYSLSNQVIDDFQDTSGISAGDSTNETRDATGKYWSGTGSLSNQTVITANGNFVTPSTLLGTANVLVVAGGGSGSKNGWNGAPGGAGGLVHVTNYALAASTTYAVTVGAGAAEHSSYSSPGTQGVDSVFDTGGVHQILTAKGGGGANSHEYSSPMAAAVSGGSGGGGAGDYMGSHGTTGGTSTQAVSFGSYTNVGYGNVGGVGEANNAGYGRPTGGGGGAGSAGSARSSSQPGHGGAGKDLSATFGTSVGDNGWFAGGGGGRGNSNTGYGNGGNGNYGGGGDSRAHGTTGIGEAGAANTGGGGGGSSNDQNGAAGGSGVVIVKYDTVTYENLTLISNSQTAESAPTKGDLVFTYSNGAGTATYSGGSPTIQAYISRNGSAYTSAVTLTKVGTTGTQTILAAHDVDLSGITAGTAMRYKITTTGQSVSLQTRIHAVSLGCS